VKTCTFFLDVSFGFGPKLRIFVYFPRVRARVTYFLFCLMLVMLMRLHTCACASVCMRVSSVYVALNRASLSTCVCQLVFCVCVRMCVRVHPGCY
jgi:hypothetical protein